METIYSRFLENPAISTDSRNIKPGSLFFALHGENFNGNDYAIRAIEDGASCAIVDDSKYAGKDGFIVVNNVLESLQQLALHHRRKFKIPVIAITGTNGKTTTKELVNAVLSRKFKTLSTSGNLNNHIGVPLTLLKLNQETEIAVIEMGANHPGEIDFLCQIAAPGFGIITNIGKAHLEGFGSFEGVIRTKTEMYRYIREKKGTIFINSSDTLLQEHSSGISNVSYGAAPANLVSLEMNAEPFARVSMLFPGNQKATIQSNLYGLYNSYNILAAACIGQYFGVSTAEIKTAIEGYHPVNNRSQVVNTGKNILILDAYNANPCSMAAALSSFEGSSYPEKTVILGDMLELGSAADEEHRRILESLDMFNFQHVYLVGSVFTRINTRREFICFHDSDLAKMWFEHHRIENSTILIKGSRGIRLEKVVETL
ncbi:MAG: UDP-N-acetylmuramoyl-tripeptide--D-alanyl-D-alanine ligase [Bacteroidetes bacterium]|nr:UDP-N-acetylmuramoyl-tripeptide--D-alanyl-D-alanine ligase [Bacteroidota bacterium]